MSASKTTRLTLGGMGRPIVGKLTAPAEIAAKVDWIQSDNSLIARPGAVRSLAVTMQKLSGTRSMPSSYAVLLNKDGSFRVEDVEAGTYDLIFVVNEPSRDPRGFMRSHTPLASARREVIVRVMADGRSDQPLDLGTIPLEPLQKR